MSGDGPNEQRDVSADGYVRRAELLADLGRYDEAAAELDCAVALAPGNAYALTVLARVHLAAGRPGAALAAAEAAGASDPHLVPALVLRGLALNDLRRFGEAAATADRLLGLDPGNGYAQRSAAAILVESRNGQQALNAAWRGVELEPVAAQAHLVLGLVAARLELFDLAEQAYREALRLDPELAEASHDPGVVRLEQRRYATALERLAEAAEFMPVGNPARGHARRSVAEAVRRLVRYGAGYSIVTVVLVAFSAAGNAAISRIWAGLAALVGGVLVWRLTARVPGLRRTVLPELLRTDRALAFAVYAVAAAPCLLLLYALVGTPWPLAFAIGATAMAEFSVLRRPGPPPR